MFGLSLGQPHLFLGNTQSITPVGAESRPLGTKALNKASWWMVGGCWGATEGDLSRKQLWRSSFQVKGRTWQLAPRPVETRALRGQGSQGWLYVAKGSCQQHPQQWQG